MIVLLDGSATAYTTVEACSNPAAFTTQGLQIHNTRLSMDTPQCCTGGMVKHLVADQVILVIELFRKLLLG